ncbi:DUF222 domain-containing protein, partial [Kribbella sp. NPDC058245]|uniref:DUF222 domain-containing protein n=1 Tax=Kribbella sp. NPDC058245 TaxID=3346399 RepID=UPI0036E19FD3
MELLGERPAWSMSGSEALADIDSIDAEIARLETARLSRVARVDETGHAAELGARNTAELLTVRHRMDPYKAHGLVRLARALPKYPAVIDALPDPSVAVPIPDGTDDTLPPEVPLSPERAAVIVSMLEKVPDTVPVENLRVAEEQLVKVARDMSPGELRKAAQRARDILDQDGPEPAEQKAYARERLNLIPDEHGVRISGYLANDNAEMICSTIHTLARPHRTIDGERDPRSAEKRRADALSTTVRIATAATDAGALRTSPDATASRSTGASAGETKPAAEPPTASTTRDATAAPDATTASAAPDATDTPDATAASAAPDATDTPDATAATAESAPDATTGAAAATAATSDPATPPLDSAGSGSGPDANAPTDVDADTDTAEDRTDSSVATSGDLPADALFNGGSLFDADIAFGSEIGGGAAVQAERCATVAATSAVGPVVAGNWVPGFGAKATLVVTIDWQDLKNSTAHSIADTVFGAGLSASTARMLACDAKIIPVVLGSKSEPLDVGRCERLVTKGMRHALNTRDRGCVVCGAPPVMCDAHHLISWIDGG